MANNLQYILRPDSSTPQSRANAAYKKLSQDFRSGLNNIAQRYQPQKPNYISRRSGSRLETDTTPHGNWYKPTMRTRQVQENAAADYDWDSKINKLYREQQKKQEDADYEKQRQEQLEQQERERKSQQDDFYKTYDEYDKELDRQNDGALGFIGKAFDKITDIIGNFANNSSEGGINESQGRIALAKTDKQLADAYQYITEIKTLKAYENQDFIDGSVDYNKLYKTIVDKYNNYKKNGYNEHDIAEMARAYENKFISKKYNTKNNALGLTDTRNSRALNLEKQKLQKKLGVDPDFDYTKTLSQKIQEINKYKQSKDQDIKDEEESLYGKGLIPNKLKRKQFWNDVWNVNEKAKKLGQLGGSLDWKDSNYFIWGQSAQAGYSFSSGAGVASGLAHTALLGASVLLSRGNPGIGAMVNNLGNAVLAPLDYEAGVGENYQEASSNYGDNIQANLQLQFKGKDLAKVPSIIALQKEAIKKAKASGLSDKEAKELYDINNTSGMGNVLQMFGNGSITSNDIRLNKAKVGATKGLKQQFMADNVRTMSSTAVQTMVSCVDVTGGAGSYVNHIIGKIGGKTVARKLSGTVAGKVVSKAADSVKRFASDVKRYENSFVGAAAKRGASLGEATSDVLGGGIIGSGVGRVTGAAIGAATKATKDAIWEAVPETTRAGLTQFAESAFNKFAALGELFGAKKIKREALKAIARNPKAADILKYLGKYGYATTRAGIVDHFSEGNEELAQYINSKEDFAKTYGYSSGNLAELLWNDFQLGGQISKFYAAAAGIGNSELYDDSEAISNWKGGFFMGGMNPSVLTNTLFAANNIRRQIKVDQLMLASTIANRAAENASRTNNQVLVDAVSQGLYTETYNAIEDMQARDQKRADRSNRLGTDQFWEKKKQNLGIINRLVNDKELNKQLEAQGIYKGTHEYNIAIADRANLLQQSSQNQQERYERNSSLQQMYAKEQYQKQVEELEGKVSAKQMFPDSIDAAEKKQQAIDDYVKSKTKEGDPQDVIDSYTQEAKEKFKNFTSEYQQNVKQARRNNILGFSKTINRLNALLNLKSQMNTLDDWFSFTSDKLGIQTSRPDAKFLQQNIDEQIKQVKEQISQFDKDFDKNSNDAKALNYIQGSTDAIGYGDQAILDEEKYQAIYNANEQLIQRQLNAMTDGVVEDNGKYEYNPDEARYRRKQQALQLSLGDKYEEKEHERAKSKDPKGSYLNKRIQAISKAQDNNSALDWLLADIASGDAVTELNEEVFKEQDKQNKEDFEHIKSQYDAANKSNGEEHDVKDALDKNKEEYNRRKASVKEKYNKRRKDRRNKLRASFLLGFDELAMQAFDGLIENTKIGFYKFEQFYNDIKEIMEQQGEQSGPRLLAIAKAMYIRHYLTSTKSEKENMNRPIDVQQFGSQVATHVSQNIAFDGYKKALEMQQKRTLVSSFHASIAYDDNNNLNVFVNPQEIDRLKSDTNYKEILSNIANKSKDDILSYLFNNSERFNNINFTNIINEIFKQPNKDDLLQGFTYYLASIDGSRFRSQSLYDSDVIRSLVQEIMLGTNADDSISNFEDMDGIKDVVGYIQSIRDRMLNNGEYKMLDTDIPVYGFDEYGNGIQSQADIVLVGNDGQIMLIDVKSSYSSQMESKMKSGMLAYHSDKTMMQKEQEHMRDINIALYDMFGANVLGTYVFPFVIDRKNNFIKADKVFSIETLDFNKPVTPYYNKSNEDITEEYVKPLQLKVNEQAEDLNSVLEQISEYTGEKFDKQEYNIFKEGSNKSELLLQIRDLSTALEYIQSQKESASDRLEQLKTKKKYTDTSVQEYPEDYFQHEVIDQDYEAGLNQVYDTCKKLDTLLSQMTDLRVTTVEERAKINELIYAIYDAQTAIDQIYGTKQFEPVVLLSEQKLIALAINKLVSNSLIYGEAANKATQWWSTQFASNLGNVSSTYFNKIRSYLDTFDDDFMNSLVGDRDLQRFWSGIFNNQFKFIVDNAQDVKSQNPTLDQVLKGVVDEAQLFIEQFNNRFPVDPNENEIFDPNSAQSINKLDDQWRELYSDTTKHFPAFLSMLDPHYFSIALDTNLIYPSKDGKVGSAELVMRGNDVCLKLTDSKGRSIYLSFDQKNDRGPKGIDPKYFARKKAADAKFVQKVRYMIEFMKTHPGYHISFTLSRSKGSIENGSKLHPVTKFLFAGTLNQHDLYNITCDKDNRIGFLKTTINVNTGDQSKMVYGGPDLSNPISGFDLEYVKRTSITQSGNMVYFYDTGELEKTVQSRSIGVPLVQPKFTAGVGGQANKIADLLWYRINQGQTMYQGYSIEDLLRQVLYIKDDSKKLNEKFNSIEGMVTLDPENKIVYIGNLAYRLVSPQDYTNLYNAICNMYMTKDSKFLQQNMSEYIQNGGNSVLSDLKSKFGYDPNLQKIELPNGLTFEREDFMHDNGKGTTGLGYMLRNGYLMSAAEKLNPPVVYVDNVQLVQDTPKSDSGTVAKVVANQTVEEEQKKAQDSFIDFFHYEISNEQFQGQKRQNKPSFANAVEEWVMKTVGITPEWIENEKLSSAPYKSGNVVLAECLVNGINLSNSVPYTIGFHEAFHRALELLVEPSVREAMYKAYRKHNGALSDREVAEGLADLFVDYMQGTKDARQIGKQGWIKTTLKKFATRACMIMKYRGDYSTIAKMFEGTRSGKYRNNKIQKSVIDRYNEKLGGNLHYEINGRNFNSIATASDKEHMARALAYIIVNSTKNSMEIYDAVNNSTELPIKYISMKVINNLCGEPGTVKPILNGQYMSNDSVTYAQRAFREVFYATLDDNGDVQFPNFKAIAPEVRKYLTEIMDAYDGKYEHEDDQEGGDVVENDYGKSIERYDRSSFEFNKLDSVSKPVKFFFATIPYYKFDNEGKLQLDLSKNKYCVPTFMPIQQVYNVLVSKLHDVKNPTDLLNRLQQLSEQSYMYKAVYDKFSRIYNDIYKYDSEGELRSIDYDKEALMVQIFSALKGHEHNFIIGRSFRNKNGGIEVKISTSNYDRDAVAYPKLWNSFLKSGQTGVVSKVVNKNGMLTLSDTYNANGRTVKMPTTPKVNAFSLTASYFHDLYIGLQNDEASSIKINGFDVSIATNSDIEVVKDRICERLRMIGITFNKDVLDNMLSSSYGGVGREALKLWLSQTGKASILNFINELSSAVQIPGQVKKDAIDRIFKTGFVSELGNWAGAYLKLTTDKMSNGMDGTKLYNESQNNSVTNTVENLNSMDKENAVIKSIMQYDYNISTDNGVAIGSIVAKMIHNDQKLNIGVYTPIGFRSDNRGDTGSKYSNLAEAEDYINKFAMAQAGYCVFPTLADKGTYMVINGVPIPGMTYSTDSNGAYVIKGEPTIEYMFDNGWTPDMPLEDMFYLRPNNQVLDQFIEYAKTEYQAILDCREQLGMHVDNPKGLPLLKDEDKIVNYHVDKKGRPAKGGITFHSLTTLRVPEGNGKIKRLEISKLDPDKQVETMEKYFYSKSLEEQRTIMALTLQEQTDNEVEKAFSLGLISKDGSNYNSLSNVCLNESQINAIEKKIFEQIKSKLPQLTGKELNVPLAQKAAHSLAIMAILQDVTYRTTIASEECYRLFIGNPGFFKNVEDIQKRIGGLMSTGDDNVNLPNLDGSSNEYYTCAEVADYEVGSQAEIMSSLKEKMREGELREIYGNYFGFSKVDEMDIGAVRQQLVEEIGEDKVKEIEDRANNFYEAYTDEINVADGASYITADMCKRMLRARGAFNNDVKKAFDILQGEDAYSWKDKKDAFKIIYEKTNLVTTKYTAYGFREHTTNGSKVSNLTVPYYNKFALFPIFECLATGKLKGIYEKMKNEGVDNLLMTSAVKVGLQGNVKFNGQYIDKPFNKYTQRLAALRRQLNTDPEEGDVVAAGTQMIKVCLSSLRLDRMYGDMTGQEVLDKLMNSINKLSEIGTQKFKDRFYSNGNIDQVKLSKYLIEQLGTRNANKNLIDALTINPETGQMNAPIAATSDASWMESMLISAANKDIINIMTPGSSFIQRSVFGIEGTTGEGQIKGQDIYNGKRLQMINEEGSMDAVISIDYFEDILPKNLSFNEARQWLIDRNIIGGNAKANTIGYRIPTQAQSSIHALRFVDVVPAVKSTVILPTEFTKITGSDFDIDHLYLARYNVNENGGYEFDPDSEKGLQNAIIDSILTVLKDDKSYNILYKSIDNDTSLVTNIAKEIPDQGNTKSTAYNFGTLHEQVTRKNDYITGKTGIGPFALNVTNHILTTLYGVKFRESPFTKITGITGFNRILDEDNNQISSWLSAFINAHVDIVKDPYISKLNVNSFTYNMINLLARNGKGKQGLYFLCQPIIREMAKADIDAKSQFTRDPKVFKSAFEMRDKKLAEMFPSITGREIDDQYIKELTEPNSSKGEPARRADIVKSVLENMDMLQKIAKNPDLVNQNTREGELAREFQVKCYIAWKLLEPYSNALNNLVQYTKIDTRKQGKNFLEMRSYLYGYNNLVNANANKSLFDMQTIRNLVDNTWIDQKTIDAITTPMQVMSGQSFQGTSAFIGHVEQAAEIFSVKTHGREQDLKKNPKVLKKISQAISSQVKTRYFIELAKRIGVDVRGLFEGDSTIYDRINSIQDCIARDAYGLSRLKDNYLLSHLMPYLADTQMFANGRLVNKPKFIQVLNSISESKMSSDMFIESWEELLNDNSEAVRNLANDLCLYAMITSGDTKGFNKLAKYVPMSWLMTKHVKSMSSFVDYIQDQLCEPTVDYDQIAQNNYMDSDLISRDSYDNYLYAANGNYAPAIVISKEQNDADALYVSIRNTGSKYNDPTSYTLYKKVGEVAINGEERALYAMIPKRGWSEKNGLNIYEYGDLNFSVNGIAASQDVIENQINKLQEYLSTFNPNILENDMPKWGTWFNQMYLNPSFEYPTPSQAVQKQEQVQKIKDEGESPSGQKIYISRQYYYKGQPQKHPNVQYVYTENIQAYSFAHRLDMSAFQNKRPVINVSSGSSKSNQACIRTDEQGNVSKNAIGLIVKIAQQGLRGEWLSDNGCFQNTRESIDSFKQWNEYIFSTIDTSKPVVFPSQMALGKAALPKEAAQWLSDQLLSRFNILSTVERNTKSGYEGYGVSVNGIVDTNTAKQELKERQRKSNLEQLNLSKEDMEEAKRIRKHCEGDK